MIASDIKVGDILEHVDGEFYELIKKIETNYDVLTGIEQLKVYSDSLDYEFNQISDELDLEIFSECDPDHVLIGWSIVVRPDFDLGV